MSKLIRNGTLLSVAIIALMSFMMMGLAYAADNGLSQFDVIQATLNSLDAAMEQAAARSGYTDSELHLAASIPMGALGAQLAYSLLPRKTHVWAPLVLGLSLGMVPGLAKEIFDASQVNNYFSTKDLGYDFLGALLGVGITYSVHLFAKHLRRKTPAIRRTAQEFGARMTGPSYIGLIEDAAANEGSGMIRLNRQ